MNKKAFLVGLILGCSFIAVLAFGQETKPEGVPISEANAYRLKYLVSQSDFEALRMQSVIQNFINTNPQIKEWNDSANKIADEREAFKRKLFTDAKLDVNEYIIDVAAGQFVKRAK